jgi:hypothetical protein
MHLNQKQVFPIFKIVDSKSGKEKREVNISTEKKTPWKVNIFAEYLDEREGFLSI